MWHDLGASLAAGGQAYRQYGAGPQAEAKAVLVSQRLVESFRALNRHSDCLELTQIDKSSSKMQMVTYFLLKGGTIKCFRMAAKYAPVAFREINTVLSEPPVNPLPDQVSCSAMLAKRMGVSDLQAVMAAGLAGGIGLSGGACGALGAAIWILGIKHLKDGTGKVEYKDPVALKLIETFLKCTNYEFECSAIVGRKFENIDDHARHLCNGGCAKIIEALAAK